MPIVVGAAVLGLVAAAEVRERVAQYLESRGHTGGRCSVTIQGVDATTGRDIPTTVSISGGTLNDPRWPVAINAAGPGALRIDWTDAKGLPVEITSDGYETVKLVLSGKTPPILTAKLQRQPKLLNSPR